MLNFLRKKGVMLDPKIYFIDVLGSMAMGLFASLLVGTILNTVGGKLNIDFITETVWPVAKDMTGPAIAVAIAASLKAPQLVLYSVIPVGYYSNQLGGPVAVLAAAVISVEMGKIVSKEAKLDIIITPTVTIIFGFIIAKVLGPGMSLLMTGLGDLIIKATKLRPFTMGIVVSVLVGIILTLPISSAALCMMLSLHGLAGGAATAGCCAHMIGFAIISFQSNGWNGLLAQGLGTSMLQMGNIVKKPLISLPPILASTITGPLSTVVFKMENNPLGSGMGTSGLVGPIMTAQTMGYSKNVIVSIILLHFILPAILSYAVYKLLRMRNLVSPEDYKLDL